MACSAGMTMEPPLLRLPDPQAPAFDMEGAYVPAHKERQLSRDAERLRESVADWSAGLAAVSDLPATVRQDVADALELARRFNAAIVRPQALHIDRMAQDNPDYIPHELIRRANEWGLFTLWLPSLFGGKGWNFLSLYAFLEEVSATCVGVANVIGVHYMGVAALTACWNLRLADKVFAEVCAGERSGKPCLISLAINEPDAGSDVADTRLLEQGRPTARSVRQPDGSHVLHGVKSLISNAPVSSWHIVMAWEDPAQAADTVVMLAVRADAPGCELGPLDRKMGQRACPTAELRLNQCRVPPEQVALDRVATSGLQRPHREIAQTLLEHIGACTRAGVAAFAAGVARGAFEASRDHAARKSVAGGRLIEQQWVQTLLADMAQHAALARQAYLESAVANGMGGLFRMMFFRPLYWADQLMPMGLWRFAARRILNSPRATQWFKRRFLDEQPPEWLRLTSGLASLAKVAASDLAMRNVDLALELVGPDALRQDLGLEKRLRDAKVLQIYEGSNEINRVNLFKSRLSPDDSVKVFVRDDLRGDLRDGACAASQAPSAIQDAAEPEALTRWLALRRTGTASANVALPTAHWSVLHALRTTQAEGTARWCALLEALAAHDVSAAAWLYSDFAARQAMQVLSHSAAAMAPAAGEWLAWPAFHAADEALWPTFDAKGHVRGQLDMLLKGPLAHGAVLLAQGRDQQCHLVRVDLTHPAVAVGEPVGTLGLDGAGIHDIEFGGVPAELLGVMDAHAAQALQARLAPAAVALLCGVARASLDSATVHAHQRQQGGGPLVGWAEVRRLLSGMNERLTVAQALRHALTSSPEPALHPADAVRMHLHAGQLVAELTRDGLQLLGGVGYLRNHPQEARLRDVRQLRCLMGGVAWRRQGGVN